MTSDLPVFDSILLTRTKTINVTEYENDASVLEFPNPVYKTNDLAFIDVLAALRSEGRGFNPPLENRIFFQSSFSNHMSARPPLTTVLRREGKFNTSLIARLKLPRKIYYYQIATTKKIKIKK